MLRLLVSCAALTATCALDAELEKRVRLKTTRQLKEGLEELGVKVPSGVDKDALRALAAEYEEKYPPKKRTSETTKPAGEQEDVKPDWRPFWHMIDKNGDYEVTHEEFVALSGGNDNGMFEKMDQVSAMPSTLFCRPTSDPLLTLTLR